jgi:hypothetical protein
MKLQGVSIEYTQIDDENFKPTWTFIIKGVHPQHSMAHMYRSKEQAVERAEQIVYNVLTQGE